MGEPLTKKQAAIYLFVRQHLRTKDYSPSLQEICTGVGCRALATVWKHLKTLEAKGLIRRQRNRARSIELVVTDGICPHCGQQMPAGRC